MVRWVECVVFNEVLLFPVALTHWHTEDASFSGSATDSYRDIAIGWLGT